MCARQQACVGIAKTSISRSRVLQNIANDLDRFGGRVDADDRVAAAVQQAVDRRQQDPSQVVAGVIGLDPDAQHPALAHRVATAGDVANLAGGDNEVFVAHQLGGSRRDLRNQAGRGGGEVCARGGIIEHPLAKFTDGEASKGCESLTIKPVENQTAHLVGLGIDKGMLGDLLQGEIRKDDLGSDPLALRPRRQTRELIARFLLVGLRENLAQVGEREPLSAKDSRKIHAAPRNVALSVATYRSKFVQGNPPARFTIITRSKAVLILRIKPCCSTSITFCSRFLASRSPIGAGPDLVGLRSRLADPGFLGPDGSRGGGSRDAGGWSRARGDRAGGRPVDRSL